MNVTKSLRLVAISTCFLGIQIRCSDLVNAQKPNPTAEAKVSITELLNSYRQAAADADGEAFFGCLDPDGIFFGTDEKERFTFDQLKATFMPYFKQGIGWKREVLDRRVYVGPGNNIGWFEERSSRQGLGPMRTTGVVLKKGNEWKIVQYNTSFAIPNEIATDVAALIEKLKEAKNAGDDTSKD